MAPDLTGTHNVVSDSTVNGPLVQARDIHIHVARRLRLFLDSTGGSYLTDADYEPGEDIEAHRDELAARLVRVAMDDPERLRAAWSRPTEADEDVPDESWVAEEVVALLALVEQRLSDQRIAQQAHTDAAERMAVEFMQLRLQVVGHLTAESAAEAADDTVQPPAPAVCPYPGLSSFTAQEAHWFFGREELTAKLVGRLAGARARGAPLFVVGVSGSGKSSLLRAGLVPALVRGDVPVPGSRDWPYVQLRPGSRPLVELVARIALLAGIPAGAAVDDVRGDPTRFTALLRQARLTVARKHGHENEPGPIVLVVDQLEEIFTHGVDDGERTAFIAALRAAAERVDRDETTPAALVVFGLRADFFSSCADVPGLAPILQDNQFLVGPMNRTELRSAIERPARAVGLALDQGLADLMIDDAGSGGGHEPGSLPLLAYALEATWAKRRGIVLTLASYQESGGVRGAIAAAAETMFTALSEPEQRVARRLLLGLVAVGDGVDVTRRRVAKPVLTGPDDEAGTVLGRLVATRLITVDEDTVEITHEALLRAWPRLTEWLDSDRTGLLVHRRLTDATTTWLGLDRDPDSLYRGAQLADLRAWLAERDDRADDLSPAEREFVEASEAAEEAARERIRRNNRRLKRGVAALAVLLVVAVTSSLLAIWQQQVVSAQRTEALAQQAIALSRQYAAESQSARDTDPRRSLLLAAAAWQAAHTNEARSAILSAQAVPYRGTLGPADARLFDVALSPDGTVAAMATAAGSVTLWDTATHREIIRLTGADGEYPSLAFSPDGRVLATTHVSDEADKRIRLWDVGTHRLIRRLPGQSASVAFSPDGASVVTTSKSVVEFWDVSSGERVRTLAYPRGHLAAEAVMSPDGSLVAAGGSDNLVHLWETATGTEIAVFTGHTKNVFSVDFNHDGTRLASSGADGAVRLWDVPRRQAANVPVLTPQGGGEFIRQVLFSPDGDYVAAGLNASRTVQLWRVSNGAAVRSFVGHTEAVVSLAFSQDGRTMLSGGLDRKAILWDVRTTVLDEPSGVSAVAFSPNGHLLAYSSGATVTLWDTTSRQKVRELTGGENVTGLSFNSDGTMVAASGLGGSAHFWRVDDGRLFHTMAFGTARTVYAIKYSPDGSTLAALSGPALQAVTSNAVTSPYEYALWQWDAASGAALKPTTYGVADAAADPYPNGAPVFSPSGDLIAVPLTNGSIELRKARTGDLVGTLRGHDGVAVAAAFNADGTVLASGGSDRTVRLWDMTTNQQIGTALTGHNGIVRGTAFLPDGTTLASVSDNDTAVQLWDLPSHTPLAKLTGASSWNGISVQPDTGLAATAGINSVVGIWNLDTDTIRTRICTNLSGQEPIADQWTTATGHSPEHAPRC